MPLQDLTPQLRTRLNRMERVVGIFVAFAALLLLVGLGYYVYHAAVRQGWFLQKVPYYVYVEDATGLKVGDPVRMMGFDIGRITAVVSTSSRDFWFVTNRYNVFVQFEVIEPNFGYIWTDSKVRVNPTDLLGNRLLEVLKGQTGTVTVVERDGIVTEVLSEHVSDTYVPLTKDAKGVWLNVEESPAMTEKVNQLVKAVEAAIPALTNQLGAVLSSSGQALSNINQLAASGSVAATNLVEITSRLRDPDGSLGRWLFPSNFNQQLETTLAAANSALTRVDTNLVVVADKLGVSLDHLASITSNLNAQVQANTNILSQVSKAVVSSDELVQGLKRHWFLKSAFKTKTNRPPPKP